MPLVNSINDRTAVRLSALRERARPKPPVLPSYDEPPDLEEQWQDAVERGFQSEPQALSNK